MQPHIPRPAHERLEYRHVVTVLCLDELRARLDLLRQPQMPQVLRRHERIRRRAQEKLRRRGQLAPAQQDPLVPHDLGCAQQMQRVKIEHPPRLRLIARAHVVARQAEDVAYAQRRRAQQIALNRNTVAVPASHLQDRLIARPAPSAHSRPRCSYGSLRPNRPSR